MNQQSANSPTLFGLLAREWTTGSHISSMCFNADQTAVGFALENGTIALAPVEDEDPPGRRIHVSAENGRSTIQPRTKSVQPLNIVDVKAGGEMWLGVQGQRDFITCHGNGVPVRVSPDASFSPYDLGLAGPIRATDYCEAGSTLACVSGSQVSVVDGTNNTLIQRIDQGETISAARFSPDGRALAVAHDFGLTIWPSAPGDVTPGDLAFPGRPNAVFWSLDGQWIAAPLSDGGFQLCRLSDGQTQALRDYPSPVRSICWNQNTNALVTSGAFRIALWSMDEPPMKDPSAGVLETGKAGLVPVSAVASHPTKNLVAAGYDNGFITIAQVGGRDEMILNNEDRGAINQLAWSRDGRCIAASSEQGHAALISLPPQMFK